MANGERVHRGGSWDQYTLLDAIAATSDGQWIDTGDYRDASLDVRIATTATVQLRGSDGPTQPLNTDHGQPIGADITASALYAVEYLPRWIKARVSAWTAGAVSAYFKAMR